MTAGSPPPLRPLRAIACAGCVGFGVMAAELTAVRLLAPHFGDSAYVWTNVIGVILAAMALGAAAGGRLSARADLARWPFGLLATGAVLLLAAPFATGWLAGEVLLADDMPLDAAMPAMIRGSLVAAALVFAPPLLLLSAVSPLLIVWLARSGVPLGRAAGDVAAAGTIGSLLGTFAATHWLVPWLGCRLALVVTAAVLLVAALCVWRRGGSLAAIAVALLTLGAPWLHTGPLRPAPDGSVLLAERETPYQFLQVLRTTGEGPALTRLVINEALDSFHSLQVEGSCLTGAYYDWHALAPFLVAERPPDEALRALSIGDAAGSLRRVYAAVHPGVRVDAVDIDAVTMRLGDRYFDQPKADGARHAVDGRLFVDHATGTWHVIHVDAYAHQVYVPAHLASREFFAAAFERLEPGGVLACNVGALGFDDDVLQAIGATVARVFGEAHALLVPQSRNALLIACKQRGLALEALRGASAQLVDASAEDRRQWQSVVATASVAPRWQRIAPDAARELVDDRPWLDELLFRSYVADRDPRQLVRCEGPDATMAAEQAAYAALQAREHDAVLQAVRRSRQPTSLLRQYAGDARWLLRHLDSAEREYTAALELQPDASLRAAVEARLASLRQELQPVAAARRAATVNGWLIVGVVLAGLAGAFAVTRLR